MYVRRRQRFTSSCAVGDGSITWGEAIVAGYTWTRIGELLIISELMQISFTSFTWWSLGVTTLCRFHGVHGDLSVSDAESSCRWKKRCSSRGNTSIMQSVQKDVHALGSSLVSGCYGRGTVLSSKRGVWGSHLAGIRRKETRTDNGLNSQTVSGPGNEEEIMSTL